MGDAEREPVIRVLSEAFATDRLSMEELEARLAAVYAASSRHQLAQLLEDPAHPGTSLEQAVGGARIAHGFSVPDRAVGLAFMGGYVRDAGWVLPRHFRAVALMGGVQLDLRDARIAPGVSEIEVFTMWGGVEINVPDGVRVEAVGMAIMGGFSVTGGNTGLDDPNAPVIRVSGLAVMAGVDVNRKDKGRKHRKRLQQALKRAEAIRSRSG